MEEISPKNHEDFLAGPVLVSCLVLLVFGLFRGFGGGVLRFWVRFGSSVDRKPLNSTLADLRILCDDWQPNPFLTPSSHRIGCKLGVLSAVVHSFLTARFQSLHTKL